MEPHPKSSRTGTAVQLGLLAVVVLIGINRDVLLDQYALATYRTTPDVAAFESRIMLSTAARAALYRAAPQYDAKANFNADCDTKPHELELGCYYRSRIYILNIDNASLAPEMDVVGAHELLHAVWSKMSVSDRDRIGAELERVYRSLGDKDLADRMAGYAASEPGEETNELHSILATEYSNLSPMLEAYYAKYFPNRAQVVARHAAYQNVFDSRRKELEQELATIRSEKATLSSLNRQMDVYRNSGQYQAYNALVPQQNRLVETINKQIVVYQSGVDEYNGLSKSLDSQAITDTEAAAK
ncbi:MAG: hypothetical protein NVS3B29_03410 [Candidatus Saccharimonadales bacterium]